MSDETNKFIRETIIWTLEEDNKKKDIEIERLNTVMGNAKDELARLRKENEILKEIAFDLAMIDRHHTTEHDDLLFESAYEKAQAWYDGQRNVVDSEQILEDAMAKGREDALKGKIHE